MNTHLFLWRPVSWSWLAVVSQFVTNWCKQHLAGFVNRPQKIRSKLSMRSRYASILFTDIANFSARMAAHPETAVIADLDRYFQILNCCVQRHNGQVDKLIGDGLMAVFPNPDDAVQAACAIQRDVACFNIGQVTSRACLFPTRVAVDTGQVIITRLNTHSNHGKTVFGQPVNLAAHLVEQTPPGRVFVSSTTWEQLTMSYDFRSDRGVVIKGKANQITVYEL